MFKSARETPPDFPVTHYSPSAMVAFSTNPILFRIKYINGEHIETATSPKAIIGRAFHTAMETYYGGSDMAITGESDAIRYGMEAGALVIENYVDGFIKFSDKIPNKQKMMEIYTYAFQTYIKENKYDPEAVLATEDGIRETIDVDFNGKRLHLAIPLKGYLDRVDERDGEIEIRDYKVVERYTDPEKIDGAKMIQAVAYYFLAYAKHGKPPARLVFDEIKFTKNADGTPQTRSYRLEYKENLLFFAFFLRYYEDMTRALMGEMVYMPNLNALYDNEVAMVAYMHGLDMPEKVAELKAKHRVDNLTQVLNQELATTASMKKLMEAIEKNTTLVKAIDYTNMQTQEKIATKMMEHGIVLKYDSTITGATVDLYRFMPSIGVKMKNLKQYTEDVEQVLGTTGVRILAPIQNSTLVGFEVPKSERVFPALPSTNDWNIYIGQATDGSNFQYDIRTAPHMLVAGASGSGKSVFLHSVIRQILRLQGAELWIFDPKRVEMTEYAPQARVYATEVRNIHTWMQELTTIMMGRYDRLQEAGVKNISDYKGTDMPYIIAVVDEFGELTAGNHIREDMIETGEVYSTGDMAGQPKMKRQVTDLSKEIETSILRLAQLGRASGIHLIVATQRPDKNVVNGTIKANFPVKVALKTAKAIDSVVMLDEAGAEKLMGKGDMLFSTGGITTRLQGYAL